MYYLILPAFNEEENIEEIIRRIRKLGKYRILVVDDGSTDNTYKIASKLKVKVIRHEKNLGKAEAVKTGINYVFSKKFKYIGIVDSDLQYLPEEIPKLIRVLEEERADFVMGFRNPRDIPFRHRLGNFFWRKFFNLLFKTKFKDTNCGLIAMNKKAAEVIKDLIYGGYILENSILISLLKSNLKIEQVPVKVFYKRKRKFLNGLRIFLGVLIFILKEGIKYRMGRDSAGAVNKP